MAIIVQIFLAVLTVYIIVKIKKGKKGRSDVR